MRPPAASTSGEMDMNSFQKLLAPKDVVQVSFERKDNFHGIGYSGLDPTSAIFGGLNETTSFKPTGREKKGIKGQVRGNIFVFTKKKVILRLFILRFYISFLYHLFIYIYIYLFYRGLVLEPLKMTMKIFTAWTAYQTTTSQ